tara:strand:+ start:11514 stop:12209 length:696 start_codon:yes stop_codon:yes gene_type:complete
MSFEKINFPIIIQARLSSQRLPSKVLKKINGIPLIEYSINRIRALFDSSKILIATSNHASDDLLVDYCKENKINYFRGSLNNVAKRMFLAANKLKAKYFVRISGDSPLIDPKIVAEGVKISQNGLYDLVTNTYPRTYPSGQSVEVIRTDSLESILSANINDFEKEHVTPFFYTNSKDFKIFNFENDENLSSYSLVVDTLTDFNKTEKIINNMVNPYTDYQMKEIINSLYAK